MKTIHIQVDTQKISNPDVPVDVAQLVTVSAGSCKNAVIQTLVHFDNLRNTLRIEKFQVHR